MPIKIPKVDEIEKKVKEVVDKVENPEYDGAKQTFGYKLTTEEKKWREILLEVVEKGWWVFALLTVLIIMVANWSTLKNFYDFLTAPKTPLVVEQPVLTESPIKETIFAGKVRELEEDLGWMNHQFFLNLVYYEAGEVIKGEFLGAKRYWVVGQLRESKMMRTYEIWKLTDGQVLLNSGKPNPRLWLQNLQDYYLYQYFVTDIVKIKDELQNDFPHTLDLNATMMLYRREVLTDVGPYDGAKHGYPKLGLVMAVDEYVKMPMLGAQNYKDLTFYSKTYNTNELFSQVVDNAPVELDSVVDQYVQAGTKIVVTDKTGVSMVYELIFKDQWENYVRTSLNRDILSLDFYQQELIKYTATSSFANYKKRMMEGEYIVNFMGAPSIPQIEMGYPGYLFKTSYFEFGLKSPLFVTYNSGLTSVCEPRINGKVIRNVEMSELEEVGKVFVPQAPIYALKENNHPLNSLVYELKFRYSDLGEEKLMSENFEQFLLMKAYDRFKAENVRRGWEKLEMPTLEEYISKMPILFIKDPWDRLIMIWENEIKFLRKCVIISDIIE